LGSVELGDLSDEGTSCGQEEGDRNHASDDQDPVGCPNVFVGSISEITVHIKRLAGAKEEVNGSDQETDQKA
jgi:hypothetical protein